MTTTQTATKTTVVSVGELKRAWRAIEAGDFRNRTASSSEADDRASPHDWLPDGRVLPVIGCLGSTGATTLALALGTIVDGPSRVIECCTPTASGLASASTEELGPHDSGWSRGTRGEVLLERGTKTLGTADALPVPVEPHRAQALTVLDVGWELGQLLAGQGWLRHHVIRADHVVVVTTATIPGLRRLEGALSRLTGSSVTAAILGPVRRKWPRGLEHSLGFLTRQLDQRGAIHGIPFDRALAVRGLDSTPLPAPLLSAADRILRATVAGPTTKDTPS